MVALHNRRLTATDIFPGVLWTEKQWFALQELYREELKKSGLQEPQLSFRLARMMEDYQRTQPSMNERQRIMKTLAKPPKRTYGLRLEEEELAWLIDRLEGVNDPTGLDILEKLRAAKAGPR